MAQSTQLPVYILHGWTQDTGKWQEIVRQLKKTGIAAKILPIPGLTAPLNKPWRLDDYVNWFNHQVSAAGHCHVIAHSFGGRIAIKYDVAHPNVIKKLVLIDAAGIRPSNWTAVVKRASFKAVAKIGQKITSRSTARKFLYRLAGEKDYYQADSLLATTMTQVIEQDLRPDLPFVKAHTLLIWGSHDRTTPLADGRYMNKTIMGSSLKIINEAKHSPQFTHTGQVVNHIAHFLNSGK